MRYPGYKGVVAVGYELLRRIAAGGMGEVFIARRTGAQDFEKKVALKLMLPHLATSPELVQRFHDEARLAARMHHPNIVEIFDVGEADARPFIAMQLVHGINLARLTRMLATTAELMPLELVRLVATGICEALAYAHELTDGAGHRLDVVHRDVTPSNILVSTAGAVQLTDFGIARVRAVDTLTAAGTVLGKAAYLAPEQLEPGAAVDHRADLYAAAVTLYELLTTVNPFSRATTAGSLEAVQQSEVPPLLSLRPDAGPRMAEALHRAMARDPAHRFPDARSFRQALVDGPVATSPDLGAFVTRLAGEELSRLTTTAAPGPGTKTITVSLSAPVAASRGAAAPVLPPRRARRGAVMAGGVAVGAAVWVALASAGREQGAPGTAPSSSMTERMGSPPEADPPGSGPADGLRADVSPGDARAEEDGREPDRPAGTAPGDGPAARSAGGGSAESPPARAAGAGGPATRPDAAPPGQRAEREAPATARNRPRAAVAPQRLKVGYLSADAVPWAEVLVQGRVLDTTPFERYPLPVGRYTVQFRGPNGVVATRRVVVREDRVTAIRVDLGAGQPAE